MTEPEKGSGSFGAITPAPAAAAVAADSESLQLKGGAAQPVTYVAGKHETAGLRRVLNGRHTYMISLASGVGTGLFLGSGSALYTAGPLGILLGYLLCGVMTAGIAFISAETIGYLPVSGGFIRFIPRYTDKAFGITIGYTFWYLLSITAAAEIVAASSLIAFWRPDLNMAIFISVFLVLILVFNLLPVRVYGESEFYFGLIKSLLVIGLIVAGFFIDWGANPANEYIGGRYWRTPYEPIHEYLVKGSTGRFLAFWSTLINAAFAMGNIQVTSISAGEVENPRVNVPKAMRRVFWRLLLFYVLSVLSVGLIMPATDPALAKSSGTAGSPFVLAFRGFHIKALPSLINAVVITSAFSSGNGVLFLASRVLVGLAQDGFAPRFLLRTNRFGSPWLAVLVSFVLAPLAYLNCGSSGAATVFGWFVNLIATAGLIVYIAICISYVRFYFGLRHRGISRNDLPYKSWGQPYCAIAAGFFCFLIVFFSGFAVFFPGNWSASSFLSNYIACFVVPALYIVLKLALRSKSPWVSYDDMDFSEMDDVRTEAALRECVPAKKMTWWRRLVDMVTDE